MHKFFAFSYSESLMLVKKKFLNEKMVKAWKTGQNEGKLAESLSAKESFLREIKRESQHFFLGMETLKREKKRRSSPLFITFTLLSLSLSHFFIFL